MSNHSEVIMAASETNNETNGKKTNGNSHGLETASETDLGSAASSVNTSGDEQDDEEDEGESDPEIQFKQSRRTTRATRASARNNSPQTLKKKQQRNTKINKNKKQNTAAKNSNSTTSVASKRPRLSRKSSISCSLCTEVVEDLGQHLSLTHFKTKLLKLLPSDQHSFKCPKCALVFNDKDGGQEGLLTHFGSYHKLNDKFLEEESMKLKNKNSTNNGHKRPPGRPPRGRPSKGATTAVEVIPSPASPNLSRRSKRTTAAVEVIPSPSSPSLCPSSPDSRIECKLCGSRVHNLNDHAFEDHFKEEVMVLLPKSAPFGCPRCPTKCDALNSLIKHVVKTHELENFITKRSHKTENHYEHLSNNSNSNSPRHSSPVSNLSTSELFSPPNAWLVPKPRNYNEFCKQMKENLNLHDGRFVQPVDDRSCKCVCGKILRLNGKYNWRYMIQRPTFTNGKIIMKGHWFMCSEVNTVGTDLEDWAVNKGIFIT